MKKVCSNCKIEKEESEFYKKSYVLKKTGAPLLSHQCKVCDKACMTLKRKEPGYQKNADLKHTFGIDIFEYERIQRKQNFRCEICNIHQDELKRNLAVDHCHSTGKIRGLLCTNCNTALGKLKESEEIAVNLLHYIKKHKS